MNYRPNIPVQNDLSQIDFVPPKSEHLNLFDNLIVKQGFYSSSMSRANLGLPPPVIDVAGYDLAIVDTPHFIKVQGIAPDRILAVVHDLIPLRDPTMDANWRNLFMRKLDATLALGSNLVFVSRCTQRAFRASFPRHAAPREFIFYPAIRRSLMANAERESPPSERREQPVLDPTKSTRRRSAWRTTANQEEEETSAVAVAARLQASNYDPRCPISSPRPPTSRARTSAPW